jgi:hypothetical protein
VILDKKLPSIHPYCWKMYSSEGGQVVVSRYLSSNWWGLQVWSTSWAMRNGSFWPGYIPLKMKGAALEHFVSEL